MVMSQSETPGLCVLSDGGQCRRLLNSKALRRRERPTQFRLEAFRQLRSTPGRNGSAVETFQRQKPHLPAANWRAVGSYLGAVFEHCVTRSVTRSVTLG
jgi:hypothetical protein